MSDDNKDNKIQITFDEPEQVVANNYPEHLIKPKYVQDKSVFYKRSGYLKDLLGEEN